MNTLVELAAGAVATEFEEQVPTTVERPPVVNRELAPQLVGDVDTSAG